MPKLTYRPLILAMLAAMPAAAMASSHREAPQITETPKIDGTDLYMFRSYEPGREGYVTILANYIPFQDPPGGPNFYMMDPDAVYDINIDHSGDAREDLTFRFRFRNSYQKIALPVGPAGSEKSVPVPVLTTAPGGIGPGVLDRAGLNVFETYTLDMVGYGKKAAVTNAAGGDHPKEFVKPVDNVGQKSIPDYAAYANSHIYNVHIPGCEAEGRVFVGQRDEPFFINVGEIFDLVNTDAVGAPDAEMDDLANKNVTSLALEVPIACLTKGSDPVIGAWTTASVRSRNAKGEVTYPQRSRVGHPLVNEVVIGLADKDRFNRSRPANDGNFLTYVTNPTLPELLESLFGSLGVAAPNNFPRNDLVAVFLTGIKGLNQPANLKRPGEMLRLNTGIAPTLAANQSNLGVLGGDLAGFPNGRRPGDDVVDSELRVAMGVLCTLNQPDVYGCVPADAPSGALPFTDGVTGSAADYDVAFPYLKTPFAGSPSD